MAIANFIPEIWSAKLLSAQKKAQVYAQDGVVNRDYEGEITQGGDTVHINSIGDPTVKTYTKNTAIADPEVLTDAQRDLVIDQQKYFNVAIDDVDAAQTKPKLMGEVADRAAYKMRDVSDAFIASLYTGVAAGNTIGDDTTPKVPTVSTAGTAAYEYLVDLGIILDDNSVPSEGRWTVVPNWYYGLLQKDDRFVDASKSGSTATLRNGEVGEAAGFRILKSNNVPNTAGAKYKIIAGSPLAISYAEQILKTEAYRQEKGFADGLKGLHVYGGKLVRPDHIAVLTASKS